MGSVRADLSIKFAGDPPRLVGGLPAVSSKQVGYTCHIYALASLFEAACQSRLGIRTKVSRAFIFYQHLIDRTQKSEDLEEVIFHTPQDPRMITSMDTSWPDKDLVNLETYGTLTESELPFDQAFVNAVQAPLAELRYRVRLLRRDLAGGGIHTTEFRERMIQLYAAAPELIRSRVQAFILKRIEPTGARLEGRRAVSADLTLNLCLAHKFQREVVRSVPNPNRQYLEGFGFALPPQGNINNEVMASWIQGQRPFVCSGFYGPPIQNMHSALVIGMRTKDRSLSKYEWKLLDSAVPDPAQSWRELNCQQAILLW